MAEQQNNARSMGPGGGPGRGPGRHGYQKPKDLRGTLGKLMRYLGAVHPPADPGGGAAGDQLCLHRGRVLSD